MEAWGQRRGKTLFKVLFPFGSPRPPLPGTLRSIWTQHTLGIDRRDPIFLGAVRALDVLKPHFHI